MQVPFGKFKGVEIDQLPNDYLQWLVEGAHDVLLEPFGQCCRGEWAKRQAAGGDTVSACEPTNVVPIKPKRGRPRKTPLAGPGAQLYKGLDNATALGKGEVPPAQSHVVTAKTARALAHPKTLEERVRALEHDLGVLAQLFLGKRSA